MGVPYTFATATTSIPLSQLDANFNTQVTIGTSTVGLGNTTTSLVGLSNVSTTALTVTNDASISGLTVGKGGGAVATGTALGYQALYSNTTASNNTAVGYQAGYSNTTGARNTFVGFAAGYSSAVSNANALNVAVGGYALYSATTAVNNTAIGDYALQSTTGGYNTAVGNGAGYLITSGTKNSILGSYTGNQNGLDIRTASNYIVLSDGDGNPRGYSDGSGNWTFTGSITPSQTAGIIGTTTNNNANAGSVGEYITANGTNITVTTTAANGTSISLTAGDWDVTAVSSSGGASATCTGSFLGINTTSATLGNQAIDYIAYANDVVNGNSGSMFTKRISLSSTTTVYAVVRTNAGTTTYTQVRLSARRVR